MPSNIDGYIALFEIAIKTELSGLFDYFAKLFVKIVRPLIMLAVWTAVFLNTHLSTIGGFTLTATYSYFFMVSLMSILIDTDVDDVMQGDVMSGTITSALVKPLSYPLQALLQSLGNYTVYLLSVGVPLFIIVSMIVHLSLTPALVLLFTAELLLGLALMNIIAFLIGTMALYFTSISGLASSVWTTVGMLAGFMIPINFFPAYAQRLVLLTPFPIIYYTPITTLLGTTSVSEAVSGMAIAAAWIAALLLFSYFWWKHVSQNITSAGG